MTETAKATEPAYTLVVTSCGRFDLLAETLRSFFAHADVAPTALVVVEDSGDEAVHQALEGLPGVPTTVLINRPQLGQMRAIDRAYEQVTTPLVFHCEDDWRFERTGFIAESAAVLAARPDVSLIGLRPRSELNPLVRDLPGTSLDGIRFFELDPKLHPEYFSYSFNPGLRRLADYRRFAPLAAVGHEPDVSYIFKQAGFRIANLEVPAVRHIGDDRHVEDPTMPPKARGGLAKLKRSIDKRIKRLRRALGAG